MYANRTFGNSSIRLRQLNMTRREFLVRTGRCAAVAAASRVLSGNANQLPPGKRKVIRPPAGKVLFIAGQGADQLGGRAADGLGNGYLDHMGTKPGGFTLYCSVAADFTPVDELARVCNLEALKNSVLHLSVSWISDFGDTTKDNNRAITKGAFDDNIDRLGQWCAGQRRPILMRIGYEFDRGLPTPDFHYDPLYFADAFRRIVDRLGVAGAQNVSTVMASTNFPSLIKPLTAESFNRFYAGDEYVDWLGCSMWNPTDVDKTMLNESRKRGKPVLLAETTPVKYNIGQSAFFPYYWGKPQIVLARHIWDGWHQPMIDFIKTNIDVIGAWHYIAANWASDVLWKDIPPFVNCDARPWANRQFLDIWNRQMNSPPFMQASERLFEELGYS
jgi:hypothetical protein